MSNSFLNIIGHKLAYLLTNSCIYAMINTNNASYHLCRLANQAARSSNESPPFPGPLDWLPIPLALLPPSLSRPAELVFLFFFTPGTKISSSWILLNIGLVGMYGVGSTSTGSYSDLPYSSSNNQIHLVGWKEAKSQVKRAWRAALLADWWRWGRATS